MDSDTEDIPPKVTQSESEEDVPHIYGSFGADPDVASSEAFQALKTAYEYLKQNYHSINEKCTALKLEKKKLRQENERLKLSSESGERISSFDISPEAADKNKIYLLQTKIEELTLEKNKLKSLVQTYEQSNDLPGNQQLIEGQCQSKHCLKRIESLEKINKDLVLDTKHQEFKIQRLKRNSGDMSKSIVSHTEETNLNDILTRIRTCDPTNAELQQMKQEVERKITEGALPKDLDMETDGDDETVVNTDLVEFDVEHFLLDYKLLKTEVSSLLQEVQTYRELNKAGMLYVIKRKHPQESDFEMEDYEKKVKTDTERIWTNVGQGTASAGIKRPPKEELGTSTLGKVSPTLNISDEDLYGASGSSQASSSSKYSLGLERAMQSSEESYVTRHISSSYGPATDVQAMHHFTRFQPGSAPNFPTSGRMASPSALFRAHNSPHGSGSQVSNQGSDFKFKVPIMQETGEGLLPPRNPPNVPDEVHVGGRNSPELFTPMTHAEKQKEEAEEGDITSVDPEWTPCPMCSRRFDRSLFSAEYINHHVNSHFDGSNEYEFVDMLQ